MHEWNSLRYRDFESAEAYDVDLSKIIHKLRLCGEVITEEDLLEKTFTTANPKDLLLQYIYREKCFTTYNDLLSCLLQAEMKRHEQSKYAMSKMMNGMAGLSID